MKKKSIVITIVLIIAALLLAMFLFKANKSIVVTAAQYKILVPSDTGERNVIDVSNANAVEKLNEILSGKYKNSGKKKSLRGELCCAIPCYPPETTSLSDNYSKNPSRDLDGKGNYITYADTIYILDKKTIALYDAEKDVFWIGGKRGPEIDTEYILSLTKSASDRD